jgi:hypothetical protein
MNLGKREQTKKKATLEELAVLVGGKLEEGGDAQTSGNEASIGSPGEKN